MPEHDCRPEAPTTAATPWRPIVDEPDGTHPGIAVHQNLEWWQAALLTIAETISLGILSLPSVLATIGLVPGLLIIVGFGLLTTYTGYMIGRFKLAYPHVLNAPDAGHVLAGPFGYWSFALFQSLFLIFSAGVHIVTFVRALDAITDYGTCSILFSACGLVLFILGSLPRTFRGVSYLAGASFISIITAMLITIIALGVAYDPSKPPPLAQRIDIFPTDVKFSVAVAAASQVGLAYGGHVTFFAIITDLKKPTDFPKSILCLQTAATTLYTLCAVLVYVFAGKHVPSPALGATSPIVRKVAYGFALVTIVAPGSIFGHINSKWIFQKTCAFLPQLDPHSSKAGILWFACVLATWVTAWIIAQSIPHFNSLLGLISSIFVSFFDLALSSWLFLHLSWNVKALFCTAKGVALSLLNLFILVVALALFGLGAYGSGKQIHDVTGAHVWSCRAKS